MDHLLKWLDKPSNYIGIQQKAAWQAYQQTKGAPTMTQALFSRFLAKQGIVRQSMRDSNNKVIKVYKQGQTKQCPTCFGSGKIANTQ